MDFRIDISDAGTSKEQYWITLVTQDGIEVPVSENDFKHRFQQPLESDQSDALLIPIPKGTDIRIPGNVFELQNHYRKAQDALQELNQKKLLSKSSLKTILDSIQIQTYDRDIVISSFFFGLFKKKRHAKCLDITVTLDKAQILEKHPDFHLEEQFMELTVYWKKNGRIPHTLEEAHEKEEYAVCKEGEGLKCYLHSFFFRGESVEIGDKESFPRFKHERMEKEGKFIFSLKEYSTPEHMQAIDPDTSTAVISLAFRPDFKALQKAFGIKEDEFTPASMVTYQQKNPGTLRGRMDMYPFYGEVRHFITKQD